MKWNDCVLISSGVAMGTVLGAALGTNALSNMFFLGNDGRIQWETLATGTAAVVAAGLTIAKLNEQIRQTGQIAADQRPRRARAARALLPLALSEIGGYATDCILGLYALKPLFPDGGSLDRAQTNQRRSNWSLPTLPENVLSLFKDCIEFVDDAPAEALTTLLRHFQIQNNRLTESVARLRVNDGVHLLLWANIEQGILDSAELYARAGALFSFARGGPGHSFGIDRNHIYNALITASCLDNLGEMDELADRWQRAQSIKLA